MKRLSTRQRETIKTLSEEDKTLTAKYFAKRFKVSEGTAYAYMTRKTKRKNPKKNPSLTIDMGSADFRSMVVREVAKIVAEKIC